MTKKAIRACLGAAILAPLLTAASPPPTEEEAMVRAVQYCIDHASNRRLIAPEIADQLQSEGFRYEPGPASRVYGPGASSAVFKTDTAEIRAIGTKMGFCAASTYNHSGQAVEQAVRAFIAAPGTFTRQPTLPHSGFERWRWRRPGQDLNAGLMVNLRGHPLATDSVFVIITPVSSKVDTD